MKRNVSKYIINLHPVKPTYRGLRSDKLKTLKGGGKKLACYSVLDILRSNREQNNYINLTLMGRCH